MSIEQDTEKLNEACHLFKEFEFSVLGCRECLDGEDFTEDCGFIGIHGIHGTQAHAESVDGVPDFVEGNVGFIFENKQHCFTVADNGIQVANVGCEDFIKAREVIVPIIKPGQTEHSFADFEIVAFGEVVEQILADFVFGVHFEGIECIAVVFELVDDGELREPL